MTRPTDSGGATQSGEPLPLGAVEVGDLVFLRPKDDHGIPKMIIAYDHGTFSHVGIVVSPGQVASCRLNDESLERDSQLDFGGVRLDPLSYFMPRHPHIGRPAFTQEEREAAVQRSMSLQDHPGEGDRSAFSFPKLFMVAAGLDAVRGDLDREDRDAILSTAAKAAELWSYSEQKAFGLLPTFFCSEAIQVAYTASTFTYEDFWTFPAEPPALWPDRLPPIGRYMSFVRNILADLDRQETTSEQRQAFRAMIWALLKHDRDFVGEAAGALADLVRPRNLAADDAEPAGFDLPTPGARDPLPTSLVTPRVLTRAPWIDWVRPLENN